MPRRCRRASRTCSKTKDACADAWRVQVDPQGNTQRVATVLMFLSEVEEGGETVFPLKSKWADPEAEKASANFSQARLLQCLPCSGWSLQLVNCAVREARARHQAAHGRCHPVLGHEAHRRGRRKQHARLLPSHQGRKVDCNQMVRCSGNGALCCV